MSVLIRARTLQRVVCKVELSGTIELEPAEIKAVLEWMKSSPIADHMIVQFGQMSPVKGTCVSGGAIERQIALIEAQGAIHASQVGVKRSDTERWPMTTSTVEPGRSPLNSEGIVQ